MTTTKAHILVVDDDDEVRQFMGRTLEEGGYEVSTVPDGHKALQRIILNSPDAVILDVQMPEITGMEVLREIQKIDRNLPVIIFTAFADIPQSVDAIRHGAYDYRAKPFNTEEILWIARRAVAEGKLKKQLQVRRGEGFVNYNLVESMGPSRKILELASDVNQVAQTDFAVIITGETGTGKELVARAIYDNSLRKSNTFMAVDCGAIPENLVESELFGHEKGAFTGADTQKPGKFETASGGTIFLDEVGNLPAGSQAKLLRVFQDRQLYRVGGLTPIKVDVRFITATNRDLKDLITEGLFREDLYYRLSEFTIYLPALRERTEDIPYLATRFLNLANIELQKVVHGFTDEAMDTLMNYPWPGNVRQLRSVVRRATLVADEVISIPDLNLRDAPGSLSDRQTSSEHRIWKNKSLRDIVKQHTKSVEKSILTDVLQYTGGNKARASRLLQIDYKTMHSKIRTYDIKLPKDAP